jgi:signal transduction histidine kinase
LKGMAGEKNERTPLFRSLRGRFLFYFLILSVLSLLLFGALFGYFAWRQMHREETKARNELVVQAEEMARDLELAFKLGQQIPNLPTAYIERVTQMLRLEERLINATIVVVNDQGELVAPIPQPARIPRQFDTQLLAGDQTRTQETDLGRLGGKVFVVAVPLDINTNTSYYNLLVIKRMQDLTAAYGGVLMRYVIIAGAAALFLSIFLALFLSNSILKPLRRLSHAAWDLAHGNLGSRVEVSGRDEISELGGYFNYMAERIQHSSQLQKDFVANVSHEIRTPLTSIEGFSQALLDDMVDTDEDRTRYLNIIYDESRRLKRLLSQLLALSRIDAGAWVLHPSTLVLSEFVQDIVEKVQPQASEKEVSLRVETTPGMPPIETDKDTIEQIIYNLLDNALKFTPQGGEVVLTTDPIPKGGARMQVSDNGQGIPEDEIEHIFDRFARVERSRSQRYGGSGLGLAVCRELLNLLGGRITVWSQPGRGSVFTVELPPGVPDLPAASGGE